MFYSNRAAAYISLQEFTKAIQDARRTIAIKPKWAKGHARLAAAHFALQDYSEVSHLSHLSIHANCFAHPAQILDVNMSIACLRLPYPCRCV